MPTERIQRRIDRLLDQAEEAADKRDWTEVQQLAREALALEADNGDATSLLAAAQEMLGDEPDSQAHAPKTAPDLPASFVSGRYEVREFLGEGSRKNVYLAHDTHLDRDVVELAFSMPSALKVSGGRTKPLLKAVATRHVPRACVERRKEGFSIPLKRWLTDEFRPLMLELLDEGEGLAGVA